MNRFQVKFWAFRHDLSRIDARVTEVIVTFDMVEVGCLFNPRYLIELFHISIQVRIVGNPLLITFKMSDVNRIKPNESGKSRQSASVKLSQPGSGF